MTAPVRPAATLLLATVLAGSARADVYVLQNGDRITGKTSFKGKKTFTVQTPFGRLLIPRAAIERILHDDGREELVNPPPTPTPPPPTPQPPVELVLVITGKTFWYAWDRSQAQALDPTLRLQATLDDDVVATYLDARPDPEEIPGALVNAFGFRPGEAVAQAREGVELDPPQTSPGRIVLQMRLGAELAGRRRLRVAYQANAGTEAEPAWDDIVSTALDVDLRPGTPARIDLRQDAGQMEFSRHRMKRVESFRLEASQE